jgi:arylsulfatase A-like enzyme
MKSWKSVLYSVVFVMAAAVTGYLVYTGRGEPLSQDRQKRHNVVLIVSDALRQDVVGCYGGVARTPNMDWLAKNGVLFKNAYSTSPWTSPSAVSIFTGNYATSYEYSREGVTKKNPLPDRSKYIHVPKIYVPHSEVLFVESLKELDYTAGMQIENINATLHNNLQGLDSVPRFEPSTQMADSINRITGGGMYDSWNESEAYRESFYFLRRLMTIDPDGSFFMVHWILDPHSPYAPVEKFLSKITVDESQLPVPKEFYWTRRFDRSKCTPPENKFIRDLYIAEVESVDERVGFILEILRHKNLMDDTYIVFTSDHGEQFGEHGLYEHGGHGLGCHYYEGLVRVPLIITGPGLPQDTEITDNVSLLGLMPTLKDLLGVKCENDMQGESYVPLLSGSHLERDYLYLDDVQEHDQRDALIENSYKLIALENGKNELYEISVDPKEEINFASRNPQLVETMFAKITQMRAENEQRQKRNLVALGDSLELMTAGEKRELIKKLRTLGYVE